MSRNDILDDFEFDDNLYLEGDEEGEVVAKFYSSMEANVAAARLRSEGIPCFLANVNSHTVLPHLQLLIRLHVLPVDADRARAMLAEAAIDTEPQGRNTPGGSILTALAILIGLLLAVLLVRAMYL